MPANQERLYDIVDFIFPKDDPFDTTPGHQVDKELRNAQIDLRLAELHEAYEVMREICAGDGMRVAERNLRLKGAIGASKSGLKGIDWSQWKGRFLTEGVTMVGHSFGATTTVEILRQKERFTYITQGIVYDIWGMSVKPPDEDPKHRIHVPLLGINSEAFMYWQENFAVAKEVTEEALAQGQPAWLLTVRGTVHISQSDFCILYPHIASVVMKTTMDPVRAIDLNIDASLDFLSRVMPAEVKKDQPFTRTLADKKLLDLAVLHDMPTEHQPDKKWMAVRLKIKHEAGKRLIPGGRRKYWKKVLKSEEEVWLHVTPEGSAGTRCEKHQSTNQKTPDDETGEHTEGQNVDVERAASHT
jgi:platelet-activating factor acetylhydrolase